MLGHCRRPAPAYEPFTQRTRRGRKLLAHYSENLRQALQEYLSYRVQPLAPETAAPVSERRAWHARAGAGGEAVQRPQRAAVVLQRQAAVDRDEATQPRQLGGVVAVVVAQLGAEPEAAHTDASDGRSDS